jgi:hypothetical protein
MKLSSLLCASLTITVLGFAISGVASACDEVSTYKGGGYTVSIDSEGGYYGCNSKNQCLTIDRSKQIKNQSIWENKGTTYYMNRLSGKQEGQYLLKVINAKNKVLVRQVLQPTI